MPPLVTDRRIALTFPVKLYQLLKELCQKTGQTKSAVIRLAVAFFHYILTMAAQGYDIQLVERETGKTVLIPTQLMGVQDSTLYR